MFKITFINRVLLAGAIVSLFACGGGGGASFDGGGPSPSSNGQGVQSSTPNIPVSSAQPQPSSQGGVSSVGQEPSSAGGSNSSTVSSIGLDPNAVALGKVEYEKGVLQCVMCHGAKGQGLYKIDPNRAEYKHTRAANAQSLADYIRDWMPEGNAQACVGSCAENIAAYIRSWGDAVGASSSVPVVPSSSSSSSAPVVPSSSSSSSAPVVPTSSSSSSAPVVPSSSSSSSAPVVPSSSSSSSAPIVPSSSSSSSVPVVPSSSSSSSVPHVGSGDPALGKALYTQKNCVSCHGATGAGSPPTFPAINSSQELFTPKLVSGGPETLADYIAKYMNGYAVGGCDTDCAKNIAAFIRNGFSDVIASSSSSSSVPASSSGSSSSDSTTPIASCDVTYGPRGLRVLTRSEFTNSVEDLTGVNILRDLGATVYASLPADNLIAGFSNNVIAAIEPGSLQSYGLAVNRVVEALAANNFASVVSCGANEAVESCGMKLIENFLPKVLRRSLTESDMEAYLELFTPEYSGGDVKEGLKLALRVAFTSPDFLYRDETGVSIVDIENGTSDEPEYEAIGTVQTMFAGAPTDPGYYAGGNVNFVNGYNMIEVVAKALVGGSGSWPVLNVSTTGFTADVSISAAYNKVYRILIPAGKVSGNQHLQFRTNNGNNQIMMESVKVSGAQEKVITAPPVVLDRDAYVLTPYQLATYLAFTFTGSTPDAALLQAAREEGLETKAQIEAQVARLIATPRARERFGEHAVQWLRAQRVLEKPKSPEAYPGFSTAVREAMVQEVRDVYTHVVLEEGEAFRKMFDGDFTFVNGDLASFYGISGVTGSSMQKVKGLTERGGLMTSGAFMAVNSHDFDNAPILRSVYFRRGFMCQNVPEPPTGVSLQGDDVDALREESIRQWEAQLAAQGGKATPRQKYEFQTQAALCATCHEKMINPLGAGMEDFSPVGKVQSTHYTGLPVAADGVLYGITDAMGYNHETFAFNGAKQLAAETSGYDVTRQCFVDNNFRMAMGTGSTYFDRSKKIELTAYEKSNYACEVQKLDNVMKTTNNSTKAMLKALGTLDSVRYRKDVQR